MDKSATNIDVVYLTFFIDFEHIHEYNYGVACLVYLYLNLGETCLWKTYKTIDRKLHAAYDNIFTPKMLLIFHNTCATLLQIFHLNHFQTWILSHVPRISAWALDDNYIED